MSLLELLFPSSCLICNRPIKKQDFCFKCKPRKTNFNKNFFYLWDYDYHFKAIINTAKYKPSYRLTCILAKILAEHSKNYVAKNNFDLVVPIPIDTNSLKKRKFNQAEMLAKEVAKTNHIRLNTNILSCYKVKRQVELDTIQARQKNMQNAFKFNDQYKVTNNKILLVDDVITSGATSYFASKELLNHGAALVSLITLAKGSLRSF